MIADECCPDCHGVPTLVHRTRRRVVKRCENKGCDRGGKPWHEEVARPLVFIEDGWVRFRDDEEDDRR